MADAQVQVVINAKDNASPVFKKVAGSAADLGKTLAVGIAAGGAAVAAGLGYAIKSAADFESQMSAVKAVSGASGEQMAQLSAKALQLGKDTVFSASEAAVGIGELVKGGVSVGDIMDGAAEATLNLATAGGVDLATAAEIASNALNIFGLSGQDMAHVSDLITNAANTSTISVDDFRQSLNQSGGVIKSLGGDLDGATVAITAMGNAGYKGSDAGTSLKNMFLRLSPSTKEAADEMDRLGITTNGTNNKFFDAQGHMRSMSEIAGVLQTAVSGLTDEERTMALQTIYGTDAIRAADVFARQGAEGFDKISDSVERSGTAAEAGRERLNNLAGDIKQLGGSVDTAAIQLGEAFQQPLRDATQALTKFVNDNIIPFIDENGPAFAAAVTAAGKSLTEGAGNLLGSAKDAAQNGLQALRDKLAETGADLATWSANNAVIGKPVEESLIAVSGAALALQLALQGNFPAAMLAAEESFTHFGLAVDASKLAIELWRAELEKVPSTAAGLATLDATGKNLATTSDNLNKILPGLGSALGDVQSATGGVSTGFDGVSLVVGAILAPFANFSKALADGTSQMLALGPVFTGTRAAVQAFVDAIPGALRVAVSAFDDFRNQVASTMGELFSSLGSTVQSGPSAVGDAFSGLGTLVQSGLTAASDAFTSMSQGIADTVATIWSGIPEDIRSDLELVVSTVRDRLGAAASNVGTAIHGWVDAAGEALGAFLALVGSTLGSLAASVGEHLGAAASAVGTTMQQWVSAAGEQMSAFGTAVNAALTELAGTVGAQVDAIKTAIMGPLEALAEAAGTALAAMTTAISGALTSTASSAAAEASGIGTAIISAISGALSAGIQTVKDAAGNVARAALQAAKSALGIGSPSKEFIDVGDDVVAGFVQGIDDSIPDAEDVASDLADSTVDAVTESIDAAAGDVYAAAVDLGQSVNEGIAAGLGKVKIVEQGADSLKGSVAGAMRDVSDAIGRVADETDRKFRDIGSKAGAAIKAAIGDADRQIKEITDKTRESIAELQANFDAGRAARAAREAVTGDQDAVARARSEARTLEDIQHDRDREDKDTQRKRDREDKKMATDLAEEIAGAKTDAERAAIIQRYADAKDALLKTRREEDDDRNYRRQQEDDERAYRAKREQEDRDFKKTQDDALRAYDDAQEAAALAKSITRANADRDERIKSINDALEVKQQKIKDDAAREQQQLEQSAHDRIQTLKDEFIAKLPPLTEAASSIVENFLAGIDAALQHTADMAATVASAIGSLGAGGGGGGGGGGEPSPGESGPGGAYNDPSTGQPYEPGDGGGYRPPTAAPESNLEPSPRGPLMDDGGVVSGPAWVKVGPGVREAFMPLNNGGNGMGGTTTNVYVTVQGSVTSERDLVESIRSALVRTGRRNTDIFGGLA